MNKIILIILSLVLFSNPGHALGPKEKDGDLTTLIGKRIFENPLNDWLEKNSFGQAKGELKTDGITMVFKNQEKGYSLTFDINFVLNSLTLFHKGGNFESFKGRLPFDLKFGMNRDSLYRIVDLRLVEVEDNPYILTRKWNHQTLELLFTSRGLNQINILAGDSITPPNDQGFVRLVATGKVISGDCDSLVGKMSWDNESAFYEGGWKNGMPHGKGYFKDKNNNWYKGEFKYGYFWGKGQLSVAGYFQYQGDLLLSRRHGIGSCKFINPKGESYEGQWRQDKMNGLGKYWKTPKQYYYGGMVDDKFNGRGKMVTLDGWIEGIFEDGVPNGLMKQYLQTENMMIEGQWIKGKREGKFTITDIETKKETYKSFQNDVEVKEK